MFNACETATIFKNLKILLYGWLENATQQQIKLCFFVFDAFTLDSKKTTKNVNAYKIKLKS